MTRIWGLLALPLMLAACGEKKNTTRPPVSPDEVPTTSRPSPSPTVAPKPEPSPTTPVASPAPVQTAPLPVLPRAAFNEPAANFAALGKKKCDAKGDRPAFFTSPAHPNVNDPLRLFVTSEKPLTGVTLLARGPKGDAVPLVLYRYGGPPYSIYADVPDPVRGKYRFALAAGDTVSACRDIDVINSRVKAKRSVDHVWKSERRWSRDVENLYSAWIERLFDAPPEERPTWTPLDIVLKDQQRNFLFGYLGLHEEGPGKPSETIRATPDCADTPFFLRAYFSWKLRLPYGNYDCNRGSATAPPRCKDFIGNDRKPMVLDADGVGVDSEVRQFNSFLSKSVGNQVQSSSGRNAIKDESTDLYPIALSRDQIRPGAVYIDPYGHLLVVSKWVDQHDGETGMMFAIDGHPDLSIGRKRFWRGAFLFSDDFTTGAGGFKWFRPVVPTKAPKDGSDAGVEPLDNTDIKRSKTYGNISFEQYTLGLDGFYDKMDEVMNPVALEPTSAYQAVLDAVLELVMERIDSVSAGEKYMKDTSNAVVELPSGYDIFETTGPWEDYSTPSRDHRLLTAFHVVEDFPAKVVRRPELFKMPPGKSPAEVKADLEKQLATFAAAKSFEYVRTDGSKQRVTLAQLLARKRGLEIGYNINDCVEIRWAAEPGTPEYSTCKRHAPAEQLARMAEYRVWWATLKRPTRGQK
jgi:hypothetical protein